MAYLLCFWNIELSMPKKMTRGDSQEEKAILKNVIQSKCDT